MCPSITGANLTVNTLVQVALRILNSVGVSKVTVAQDGQQAVDEIRRKGGADAFAIVLTDLQMPCKVLDNCCLVSPFFSSFATIVCQLSSLQGYCHSQGGIGLISDPRSLWPKSAVKAVAVTADAFEDTWEDCLASGFDGWLAKPFGIENMRHILEAVLLSKVALE